MSEKTEKLTYREVIDASPAELYGAFTNSTALREWLCDTATVSARPNGHLFVSWNDGYYAVGHFTELEENHIVAFTWQGRDEPRPTDVRVTISPEGGASALFLEHGGIGAGPEWEDKAAAFDRGWRVALENLRSVLTTGEDLRLTRRPMLGVLPDRFDADDAVRLGVPVSHGVRLNGVVPGQGAEAAGLRADDVIVSIDGLEITDLSTLRRVVGARRAGDTVVVGYYRGSELLSVSMILSGRKIPVIPETAGELAERVRLRFDRDERALDEFLSGITDVEASLKPGPQTWNVKQTLAHLIQGERFNHQWIGELVSGSEGAYDRDAGNSDMRIDATVHAFPTVGDLMTELKRLNAETVSLLENLPDAFVRGRHTYWRLASAMLEESYSHIDDHLAQMRAAVAAVREGAVVR